MLLTNKLCDSKEEKYFEAGLRILGKLLEYCHPIF